MQECHCELESSLGCVVLGQLHLQSDTVSETTQTAPLWWPSGAVDRTTFMKPLLSVGQRLELEKIIKKKKESQEKRKVAFL